MPRTFASLAIATLTLFAIAAAVALIDSDSAPDRHVLLGIGALLLSCLVQVISFTYLTVTGKVIVQAAHLAKLDPACLARVKQYKRSFSRHLGLAVISAVLASASGGAAWRSHDALSVHIPAAVLAAIIHSWIYWRQHRILRCNADLVEATLKAYSSWRTRRTHSKAADAAGEEGNVLAPQ